LIKEIEALGWNRSVFSFSMQNVNNSSYGLVFKLENSHWTFCVWFSPRSTWVIAEVWECI